MTYGCVSVDENPFGISFALRLRSKDLLPIGSFFLSCAIARSSTNEYFFVTRTMRASFFTNCIRNVKPDFFMKLAYTKYGFNGSTTPLNLKEG